MNERSDAVRNRARAVGNRAGRRLRHLAIAICAVAAATALSAPAAQGADRIYSSYFDSDFVSFLNLDGSGGDDIDTTDAIVDGPMGTALDPAHNRVYWANWGYTDLLVQGQGDTISYANLDGTGGGGTLDIDPAFVVGPHGLAIDSAAGKIYWANYGEGDDALGVNEIAYANLNGTNPGFLNTTGATVNGPRGVTLDLAAGRIYWANYDRPGNPGRGNTISYANLDGTGGDDLVTMDLGPTPEGPTVVGPEGVALDTAAGRIYWANFGPGTGNTISYANLDGTGGDDLATPGVTPNRPHGVAIDSAAGEIYWANYGTGPGGNSLGVANLNGSGATTIPVGGRPTLPTLLDKPLGTGLPSIGGEATLGCGRGSWAPDLVSALLYRAPQTQSYTYQWTRDGQDIGGATSNKVTATELGDYRCRVTAHNAAGATSQTSGRLTIAAPAGPPSPAEPSNSFEVGQLKLNKQQGTAKLAVTVPGPGTLSLSAGKKLNEVNETADDEGVVRLTIQARGKTSKALRHKGKVTLNTEITYTPTGGEANTERESITLKEKSRG